MGVQIAHICHIIIIPLNKIIQKGIELAIPLENPLVRVSCQPIFSVRQRCNCVYFGRDVTM